MSPVPPLADAPRLSRRQVYRRRRVVVGTGLLLILAVGLYLPLTLLAPVSPAVASLIDDPVAPAAAAAPAWPGYGASAVGAVGWDGVLAQSGSTEPLPIASVSKVVTALVVLDAHPLAAGAEGPAVTMGRTDLAFFDDYQRQNGKVLPVQSGQVFTQHDLLEISLIESANNYTASLAGWAFGSVDAYAGAASGWLERNGLSRTRIVEPTGIDPANTSSPSDLVALGKLALANPVVAAIVGTRTAEMHDLGELKSTNSLVTKDGVTGIKTGTLDGVGSALLFSAVHEVGGAPVTIVGVVLGGPDHERVSADVRALLDTVEAGFRTVTLAEKGEAFADYDTVWGVEARAVAAETVTAVVWSDTPIAEEVSADAVGLGPAGLAVGEVDFTAGPVQASVPLVLSTEIADPGPGWRLSNPGRLAG